MKKVIYNLALITVLAIPCIWLAADSYFLQFLGLIYTFGFIKNILFPVYKRIHKALKLSIFLH